MTNKLVLRSTDEFMADYVPTYQPFYPLLLSKSQAYSEEVGTMNFRRLEAVGDIRTKHITPKDTEIREIAVTEKSKSFKKYFLANRYVQSNLQDSRQNEDVVKQVLDENQKYMDDLVLLGEGSAANNVVNNGLYWSADPNYILESSAEVDNGSSWLPDLHAKVITAKLKADSLAGRKVVVFYGADMLPKVNGIYASSSMPFKTALTQVLGGGYSVTELPSEVTPSGANGFMIVNLDQVKLHYTVLPQLKAQGVNEEMMYSWHNFLMGSAMVEVLAYKGVIRQPLTFEAA